MFVIAIRAFSFVQYVEETNKNGRPILSHDVTRALPFATSDEAWTFATTLRQIEGELDVMREDEEWN